MSPQQTNSESVPALRHRYHTGLRRLHAFRDNIEVPDTPMSNMLSKLEAQEFLTLGRISHAEVHREASQSAHTKSEMLAVTLYLSTVNG